MPTTKGTSSARSKSKTDMETKATSKPSKVTKTDKSSASRAAKEKSDTSKKVNSGGTRRTASKQAEPTKTRQAKAASSAASSGARPRSATASKSAKSSSAGSDGNEGREGIISRMLSAVGVLNREPNAISLLKKDHRRVEALFEKVKANEDGNNRPVFKKIKTELDIHTQIEEKVFYPQLLKKGNDDLQKIVREGIEEHGQVKILLQQLDEMKGDPETFRAKLKVVMENVEHHVKEEENEMFPMVEDQLERKALERLGERMEAEKLKLKERAMAKKSGGSQAKKTEKSPTATASRKASA